MADKDIHDQLACLEAQLAALEDRMINKEEVVERLGMTVSWLNNSSSELATKIRESGIRYGTQRTSPIRFSLKTVMTLLEDQRRTDQDILSESK